MPASHAAWVVVPPSALVAINLRLDRMFHALVGGFIVIVAAMTGTAFMP
jgi:hypothetical protein